MAATPITKRQHLAGPADNDDIDDDEIKLKHRLELFPEQAVSKGEDVINIQFEGISTLQEESTIIKPVFTHQIFPESYHCGFNDLKIVLKLDPSTWRVLSATETFSSKTANDEGSGLQLMKTKECVRPLFEAPTEAVEQQLHASLPGRQIWEREDGFALKWCDELDTAGKILLSRCLAVSTFFIERASQVDLDDENWKLLLLVQRSAAGKEVLVGFTSIYQFRNPLKDSRSFRVCVMLVLPKFQRKCFGELMLSTIYREASELADLLEVTVEDPCEAFTRMRHRAELSSCKRLKIFFDWPLEVFEPMPWKIPADTVIELQRRLRFTERELRFCFECAWLKKVQAILEPEKHEEKIGTFRLRIKTRISKDPGDIILPDKKAYPNEYKRVLQEEYLKEIAEMELALKAVEKVMAQETSDAQ